LSTAKNSHGLVQQSSAPTATVNPRHLIGTIQPKVSVTMPASESTGTGQHCSGRLDYRFGQILPPRFLTLISK